MDLAFDFIMKNGGLTSEDNYPYTAADGSCNAIKVQNFCVISMFMHLRMPNLFCFVLQDDDQAVSIDGHEDVPVNDEDALMKAVANQPVSVAIDAGSSDFQFYSKVTHNLVKKS